MQKLPIDASLLGLHVAGDLGPLTIYRTKRGRTVAFPKAPPTCPPSPAQLLQRYRFRRAVEHWHELTLPQRFAYDEVVRLNSLCLTGFNLWIHFCLSPDTGVFKTVQRQAGIVLYPPPQL